MKNTITILTLVLFLSTILFYSCKKKEVDNEIESITDNALCEQEFMRIQPAVNGRAISTNGVKKGIIGMFDLLMPTSGTCPKDSLIGDTSGWANGVYTNTANLPGLLLDWGNGCSDQTDGIVRSGQISTRFTKPYSLNNCTVYITFSNYKVGNISYSGNITTTRDSLNNAFTITVSNGHCTNGNWNIDWNTTKTIRWIAGFGDSDESNDVFEITGSSSGVNRLGRKFSVEITSPLIKKTNCKWITKGVVVIKPEGLTDRKVDYGDGSCDPDATFTANGNTFGFKMN